MPCRANATPYVTDKGAIVIYPGGSFAVALDVKGESSGQRRNRSADPP
jgi:hypothetical protein